MTRSDFDKLVGLDKRRIAAINTLDKLNGARVTGIMLSSVDGDIYDQATVDFMDTALRQHLEDKIDTITRAMHQLGVEADAPDQKEV